MACSGKPVIGLAGGIGAGKSEVARILEDLGCVVSRSDEQAREALRDPDIQRVLRSWWGDDVFDDRGEVDRGAVARIVFTDAQERRRLEGLVHPLIESRRRTLFEAAPLQTPALVIDAPLLFEAGLDALCDAVIFIAAARIERLARLAVTRGWDQTELDRREQIQMPLDVKQNRADYVVVNDGSLDELTAAVTSVFYRIAQARPPE